MPTPSRKRHSTKRPMKVDEGPQEALADSMVMTIMIIRVQPCAPLRPNLSPKVPKMT
jgi:hypothetical protein